MFVLFVNDTVYRPTGQALNITVPVSRYTLLADEIERIDRKKKGKNKADWSLLVLMQRATC